MREIGKAERKNSKKPVDTGLPKYYNTKRSVCTAEQLILSQINFVHHKLMKNGGFTYVHFYGHQGEHRAQVVRR